MFFFLSTVSFFQCHNGGAWNITKTSEKTKKEVKGQGAIDFHEYADLSPEANNQERDNGIETMSLNIGRDCIEGFFLKDCVSFF